MRGVENVGYITRSSGEPVKFVRGLKSFYEQTMKRNDTLYFIYETEESTTGELFLGNKQIGDGKVSDLGELIKGIVEDGNLLVYDEAEDAWTSKPLEEAIRTMSGATAEEDGQSGLVPTPKAGDQLKFLRGDGKWVNISSNPSSLTPVDNVTIEINQNDQLQIKNYSGAAVGTVLTKTANGLQWTQPGKLSYKKVSTIEDVVDDSFIYLVPTNNGTGNLYNEYMVIDNQPELIGSAGNIDFSNYVTTSSFNTTVQNLQEALNKKVNQTDFNDLTDRVDELDGRLTWQEIVEE